jgi:hypothetical protein
MIAEDARVPASYRKLLGSLRDENETMSAAALWHTLPHTVRTRMSHLGRCLGTGSVKQVNLGRFGDRPDEPVAVAVLRRRVQDEALASLSALEVSEDLAAVASRLGQLVYGEPRPLTTCNRQPYAAQPAAPWAQAAAPCPCAQASSTSSPRGRRSRPLRTRPSASTLASA